MSPSRGRFEACSAVVPARPKRHSRSGGAIHAMNEMIARDERVTFVLLGIADGMTVARRR